MSFSEAFTVSQSAATPANITLTDTSTGSDVAIVSRRAYITNNDGEYVVPSGTSTDYVDWPLADNPLAISDLLTQDTAVNILVEWLDVGGNVLYDSENDFCLVEFNKQNFYYQIQQLALNPKTLQDTNYSSNLQLYWTYIIGAQNAVELGADLAASQSLLNLATNMLNNNAYFF